MKVGVEVSGRGVSPSGLMGCPEAVPDDPAFVRCSRDFWTQRVMARAQTTSLWSDLAAVSLYKRNQGKLVRQLTAAVIFLTVALGAYSLSQTVLISYGPYVRYGVPALIGAIGGWFAFRVIHHSPFAEFLISVDGELSKVTWASRGEVYRATVVVVATMFLFAIVLYVYDFVWMKLLSAIGVLQVV